MVKDKKIKISPSILSLSKDEYKAKIELVNDAVDFIHIDVMDGNFVSNKTDGVGMFEAGKSFSNKPLDVHLMVQNPLVDCEKYKGSEIITFHIEAVDKNNVLEIINKIKKLNAKVGISIKPNTSVNEIKEYLKYIDLVLIMLVEPGKGGQKADLKLLEKITQLRDLKFDKYIEIDGGVNLENIEQIKNYDLDIAVAGTAIFSSDNEIEVIKNLKI